MERLEIMNKEFLKEMLNTVSVTGNEEALQQKIIDYSKSFADKLMVDPMSNVISVVNPKADFRIMLCGHADEIGFRVTYVDDGGFIHVQRAGGVNPKLYVGYPMQIIHEENGKYNKINGVGVYTRDLLKKSEFDESDLLIDIGANSKEEALKLVSVGDSVCADTVVRELLNDNFSCRALDDKSGAFTVIEAGRKAKEKGSDNGIYVNTSTGEESSGRGAYFASEGIKPDCAVIVDVTWGSDYPGTDKGTTGDIKVGGGPVLCLSGMVNKKLNALMQEIAREKNIPLQYEIAGGRTATDGDTIAFTGNGVPIVLVSIPERYMHSSVEVTSWKDIEQCIELIAEFCVRIKKDFDFNTLKI